MNVAYIALGSNIGNREETLLEAIRRIDSHKAIKVRDVSSIYETDPVGYKDQPTFLNMVICVKTDLEATELLSFLQATEQFFGRKREVKWGPRTLDLDILLYNQENIEIKDLIVPHPRMWERGFVLIPLREIADYEHIPKEINDEKLQELRSKEGVRVWKPKNGEGVSGLIES
ncbi:2-amino-4-hydroxy-6-hydroxymethyldihydropteridine diphosphokinase [Sutcliffiella cohnii]